MHLEGGCYCGKIRYSVDGEIAFKGQCHCRECQYISGGHPNIVLGIPAPAFSYTQGETKKYQREELENPVTREFCPDCGTHIMTRSPFADGVIILKVGTLDDPTVYDKPDHVIFTVDKQPFHHIPEGAHTFERFPERD